MPYRVREAQCFWRSLDSEWGVDETTPLRPKILKPPPNHPPQNKPPNRNEALLVARTDYQCSSKPQSMFRARASHRVGGRPSDRRYAHSPEAPGPGARRLAACPEPATRAVYLLFLLLSSSIYTPAAHLLAPRSAALASQTRLLVRRATFDVHSTGSRKQRPAEQCHMRGRVRVLRNGQGSSRNTAPFLLHLNVP